MRHVTARRAFALATLFLTVIATASPARAETAVQRTYRDRHAVVERVHELQRLLRDRQALLTLDTAHANVVLGREPGRGLRVDHDRWTMIREEAAATREEAKVRLRRLDDWVEGRLTSLRAGYASLDAWLGTYGVFRACPVPGYTTIANDFGQMVRMPHVPVHRHMGSDVSAPTGAAIVAPFDGYASTSWSELGGREVRVHGELGYVYNAHLVASGSLGYVSAGEVIGYVGSTGDATGPHDHFEWHPWDGAAQNPYALLIAACLPVAG